MRKKTDYLHTEIIPLQKVSQIKVALLIHDYFTHKDLLPYDEKELNTFSREWNYMNDDLFEFSLQKDGCTRFIELWNKLPHDWPMRCFTPGYRVSIYKQSKLYFKAAICWKCIIVSVEMADGMEGEGYTFNGNHKCSKELLLLLQVSCRDALLKEIT